MSDRPLPLQAHLEELRRRILWSFYFWIFTTVLAFLAYPWVLKFFLLPLGEYRTVVLSPAEGLIVVAKICLFAGALAAAPFWLYQLWAFLRPALYPQERRMVLRIFPILLFLLLLGFAFGYWVLAPLALRFLLAFSSEYFQPMISTGRYFSFLFWMILDSGIIFLIPLFSYLLTVAGILTPAFFRNYWKYMVVGIFLLAGILTPSPDVLSQLVLAGPLLLLWGSAYIISVMAFRRKGVPHG